MRQAVAIGKQFPGVPDQDDLEPRRGHDARLLPADLAMRAARRASTRPASSSALHVRVSGQSINAFNNHAAAKDGKDDRQLQGYYEKAGDAQLGYEPPNLLHRIRDAQHARAGRAVARRQHQPERRLHGMLHRRGGACGGQGPGRVPPRADVQIIRSISPCSMRRRPRPIGASRCPPGVHRGVAQFMGYGSYSAAVAEVSVNNDGKVKVHRMVLALNCGHAVNPDQIAAQVEGSVAYGLSARVVRRMHASTRAASWRRTSTRTRSCGSRKCRKSRR